MDTKIRLTRKPFSTALWLALVTAMTVLLCVGAGLWYSSEQTATVIDGLHSTTAYRTDIHYTVTDIENGTMWSFEPRDTSVEDQKLLAELDCVEAVYENTLTGGYSPRFTPLISASVQNQLNEGYDEVIFIATVVEMETIQYPDYVYDFSKVKLGGVEYRYGQSCLLQIEEYLSVSKELCLIGTEHEKDQAEFHASFLREADTQFLEVGKRYVFSGTFDQQFRFYLGPNNIYPMDDGIIDGNHLRQISASCQSEIGEVVEIPKISEVTIGDPFVARIEGTAEEFLADPDNAEWLTILAVQDMAQHSVPILGTDSLEAMYLFANSRARITEGRSITQEEYNTGARVCVLSTALAEKSGIKVGDTIPISQFWCDTGSETDNWSTSTTPEDGMLNNPTIGSVSTETELMTRDEEFTVIGLYQLRNEWSESSYDVTPNTVFIPKAAQLPGGFGGFSHSDSVTYLDENGDEKTATQTSPDASWGVYHGVKLKNGSAEEFQKALVGTGLEGQYIVTDQGYGSILGSIRAVSESSRQLFALVCVGWLLLLCLYLLLYQGFQRRNLGIMRSLGASPRVAGRYLLGSGMTVAALGVGIGSVVSLGLLSKVQNLLYEAATYTVTLSSYSPSGPTERSFRDLLAQSQLPPAAILLLAAAQLTLFALTMYIQSRSLSRRTPRLLLGKT